MRLVLAQRSARQNTRIRTVLSLPAGSAPSGRGRGGNAGSAPSGRGSGGNAHLKWSLENVLKKSSAAGWGVGKCHCFNSYCNIVHFAPHGRCLRYTSITPATLQGEAWKRKVKAWMAKDSALFLASCTGEEERFSVGDPP